MNTRHLWTVLLLAVVLFGAVNLVAGSLLRGARLDLTENRLYTLTDGARAIARDLDEGLDLEFFYSADLAAEVPWALDHSERVLEVLEEFERASAGKLRLSVVHPEPYSEAEERAQRAGLGSIPVGAASDPFFLGLVGRNAVGDTEIVPFFRPDRETFLEYDVAKLISTLDAVDRTTVGLLSSLPVDGGGFDPLGGGRAEPEWLFVSQLRALYDLRQVAPDAERIDPELDVLLIVHPQGLAERTLYAIDQYALAGGRAVVLVDPWCEAQPADPANPMARFQGGEDRASDLGPLLAAWGLELAEGQLAADRGNAMRVTTTGAGGQRAVLDYVLYGDLGPDAFAPDDPLTAQLSRLVTLAPGALSAVPDAGTRFEPLVETSADSMLVPTARVQFMPDPAGLLREFVSRDEPLTLAARVSGPIRSAFPDGPPDGAADGEGDGGSGGPEDGAPAPGHLAASTEDFAAVVIADADLLDDRAWARRDPLFGTVLAEANNLDLVLNAIEQLAGQEGLLAIRARAPFGRPFGRVDELRRAAEGRYQAEQQRLQDRLDQINAELAELQRATPDGNRLLLGEEELAKIDEANLELAETRKELRQVRLQLNRDVDRLGRRLAAINIGVVPLVWLAAGLGIWHARRNRLQRRKR